MALPGEPSDDLNEPTFIEASRLHPAGHGNEGVPQPSRGVRSITILPAASRACILCNGTVSFYTLPELSPAPTGREVQGCQWVGGIDLNQEEAGMDTQDLMIANSRRITIVRVGDRIQRLKTIQLPGCVESVRRDTIACVADGEKYALLEVEHQQKIPLFPVSSLEELRGSSIGQVEDLIVQESVLPARTSSLAQRGPAAIDTSSHSRSSSLGNFVSGRDHRQLSPRADRFTRERPASPGARPRTPSPPSTRSETGHSSSPNPMHRLSTQAATSTASVPPTPNDGSQGHAMLLRPHILSLTPNEFLLTTGTTGGEPGVGIFVNLEGDVVRGTIEFERYPESIVFDGSTHGSDSSTAGEQIDGSLCLIMGTDDSKAKRMQIISLKSDPGDMKKSSDWVKLPEGSLHVDLQSSISTMSHSFVELVHRLKQVRLRVREQSADDVESAPKDSNLPEWETRRNKEESVFFFQHFGKVQSQVIVWSDNNLYCLVANPLVLQLEAQLLSVEDLGREEAAIQMFEYLRGRDATTETEFLSFNYIRQRAGLNLLTALISKDFAESTVAELGTAESVLIESNLDPRIVMLLLPTIQEEVMQGPEGIWLSAGLAGHLESVLGSGTKVVEDVPIEFWQMIKRYLAAWQGKRGFGSITDEQYVFDSVDAALLHVLLHLEQSLPRGSPAAAPIRAKLNNVVDNWKGDFKRAVQLLEDYRRLFSLSRLYQSRRLARDVLATWKRVIDGEADGVGELNPESAALQIRRYLVNIRDTALVQEYAIWLAQKTPNLAVEVFTDDKGRAKFQPTEVVQLLKQNAPGAVQDYLEHLVFNKGNTKYADELIGYYLDSVLNVLESSETARESLAESYSAYRALEAPKPTYLNFIHANASPEPWWRSRLRLLQLLGGGTFASAPPTSPGSDLTYSIPAVLVRLAPFSQYLVSESIILEARQGRHREALRLLTHGLGDYDTAVRYCYFAGPQQVSSSFPIDSSLLPPFELQKDLFNALLDEFLRIEDLDTRLDRSSELLAKFAKWFDPAAVLERVPDEWSLVVLREFLLRAMRVLRSEMWEAGVVKALSAAENLRKQAELVEVCEKMGARIEAEKSLGEGDGGTAGAMRGRMDLSV